MKIKKLKLKNFGKFTDFECIFNDETTHLVGVNGSGKTTVGLTAIWACLKGIAERSKDSLIGERFRFIGKGQKSADLQIDVYDEKTGEVVIVKNHMTQSGNQITCEPVQDKEWLFDLFNVAFLSAKNFSNTNSKQQALLLGIDTNKYDQDIKILKDQYTFINREIRAFGEIDDKVMVERVDLNNLIEKKDKLESEYYEKQRKIEEHNHSAKRRQEQRDQCKDKIADLKEQLAKCGKWFEDNPEIKYQKDTEKPDIDSIKEKISNAQEINQKADEYNRNLERKKLKKEKEKELLENKEKQEKVERKRLKYITDFEFGFDGLEVDYDGNLMLNKRPIKEPYFSKGELEMIVAKLYTSQNPKFKLRFIDDFELLDEDNQKKIVDDLLSKGFQVITAEVGKEKKNGHTILLKECKSVETYKEQEKIL